MNPRLPCVEEHVGVGESQDAGHAKEATACGSIDDARFRKVMTEDRESRYSQLLVKLGVLLSQPLNRK